MYMHYICTYDNWIFNRWTPLKLDIFSSSTLYWTVLDHLCSLGTKLNFFRLNDVSTISTIDLEGRRINNLTFEPFSRTLYWISHTEGSAVIEMYNISSGKISRVADDAGSVEGI